MNKILIFVFCVISFNVSAQELIGVMAEENNENGNGTYTNYSIALQNINDVKILDIKKEDANTFLKSETYFPNLTYLNIHFSKYVDKVRSFENFNNLETIAIRYCWDLTKLPENFTSPKSLKKVYLYNCGLKGLNESFFSNPNLESVGICGNRITEIPEIPVDNNIHFLNIGYNPIYELPISFENLKKLKILSLKGIRFEKLPNEILTLTELEKLELSRTNISNLPNDINKLKKLKYLYLVGTPIKSIPSQLKKSKLKVIWMSEDNLSKKEKNNIIKSLPKDCEIVWTSESNQVLSIDEDCYCDRN